MLLKALSGWKQILQIDSKIDFFESSISVLEEELGDPQ